MLPLTLNEADDGVSPSQFRILNENHSHCQTRNPMLAADLN